MINLGTGILKLDFSPWMLVKGHSALHGTYSILPSSKAQGSSCQILDKIIGLGLVTRKRYSALAQDMLRSHSKSPRWSCDRKTLTVGNITFQWCVVVASCFCVFINTIHHIHPSSTPHRSATFFPITLLCIISLPLLPSSLPLPFPFLSLSIYLV